MKKLIVFFILIFFLALWGFGFILPDAGYILVILGQKTVETSLWFACFAILAVVILWWILTRVIFFGWSMAQQLTDLIVFGSTERASKRAASGLIDFLSGDWFQARKKLLRTATKVESPLVNYLAAARASYELGDQDEALKILNEAKQKYPRFAIPVGIAQAKMEISNGRYDQASNILLRLQQLAPKNPLVINGLREIHELRKDWIALGEIFPQVKKLKLCSVADTLDIESSVMIGQLQLASEAASRVVLAERVAVLRKAWSKVPSYQQRVPRVVFAYTKVLIDNLQDQEAESLLSKTLAKSWDDSLVDLYGLLRAVDISEAIRSAESWLKYYPQNPHLLRALGRLNLRFQQWNSASDYFQRSLNVKKDVETYAELARLLKNMGETKKSLETYQAALQLSAVALPDLPQPSRAY